MTSVRPILRPGGPLMMIGEAPGEHEVSQGFPFVGPSGQELKAMIRLAGGNPDHYSFSNVFHDRPPDNNIAHFCVPLKNARHDYALRLDTMGLPPTYIWRQVEQGKYLDPAKFVPALRRLESEILEAKPNIIVALGNTASIALGIQDSITKARGTIYVQSGRKVLPTFHPAAVLRQWNYRPIVIKDLEKAIRNSTSKEFSRPRRLIHIPQTVDEACELLARIQAPCEVSVDIETKNGLISTVGFALSPGESIVIPFINHEGEDPNFWPDHGSEVVVYRACARILRDPAIRKVFQNGLYDVQYFLRVWRVPVLGYADDTMLMHHAMYPELQKSLGILGSFYTEEPAWKMMHHQTSNKREE